MIFLGPQTRWPVSVVRIFVVFYQLNVAENILFRPCSLCFFWLPPMYFQLLYDFGQPGSPGLTAAYQALLIYLG